MAMIDIKNVSKWYGQFQVLTDCTTEVAKGEVELGLYNVSEIPEGKGLKFAGPVPPPLQINTTYEGALMSDGSVPEAARAFIRFLGEPEARAKWIAAKLEPLPDH